MKQLEIAAACLAFFSTILFTYSTTSADVVLAFSSDSGSSFSTSFDIAIGDNLTIDVFVRDSGSTTLATDGLFGFHLTGTALPMNTGTVTTGGIGSIFDFDRTDNSTSSTIDWQAAVFSNTIPIASSIHLGSFDFSASSVGTTTFTFADANPGTETTDVDWLSGLGIELDQTIFGAGATDTYSMIITAAAIPEPSSLAILLVAAAAWHGKRRRSKLM